MVGEVETEDRHRCFCYCRGFRGGRMRMTVPGMLVLLVSVSLGLVLGMAL